VTLLAREPEPATTEEPLRSLCDEAVALAHRLQGSLQRLTLRRGDCEIEVEWPVAPPSGPVAGTPPDPVELLPAPLAEGSGEVYEVRAPLVGTFYAAARPGAAPFVQVGADVAAGDTLAIVEAMKLMNPIVAERPGRVLELCVRDGEPVEFDQPLIRLEPASGGGRT
jgi:acetyl-CoA carboxylase biotin carboxyl carrier protein